MESLFESRLSNLFYGMDENTPVRYTVYYSLIKVAATCNAIAFIPTELDQVCTGISGISQVLICADILAYIYLGSVCVYVLDLLHCGNEIFNHVTKNL